MIILGLKSHFRLTTARNDLLLIVKATAQSRGFTMLKVMELRVNGQRVATVRNSGTREVVGYVYLDATTSLYHYVTYRDRIVGRGYRSFESLITMERRSNVHYGK